MKDYVALAPNDVRRKDREVADEAWIRDMLRTAPSGVMATARDGQPFVNSNLFAYDADGHCIYMHTSHAGPHVIERRRRGARGVHRLRDGAPAARTARLQPERRVRRRRGLRPRAHPRVRARQAPRTRPARPQVLYAPRARRRLSSLRPPTNSPSPASTASTSTPGPANERPSTKTTQAHSVTVHAT